ncbi:hypothetical protein CH063_04729 [Colletotrichum higginsianum]|uniref:Uncharacterized protein n=1 Tax=Colletotrichum higginsianum (strain IMI 349063) TaxID=759273 RepID=H1UWG7_COLHI|nr:hypothetical protein CH063_04729 [Colletotrichum higginsianum]
MSNAMVWSEHITGLQTDASYANSQCFAKLLNLDQRITPSSKLLNCGPLTAALGQSAKERLSWALLDTTQLFFLTN